MSLAATGVRVLCRRVSFLKTILSVGCDPEEPGSDSDLDGDNSRECPVQGAADDAFSQNFHRMFDSFFSGKHPFFCPEGRAWNPPTDIFETEDALHVKIEVAGLKESDIEVKVNQDYLMIRGHRKDNHQKSHGRFHLMEIHYGSFERILRLPHVVDIKKISATLENGFLMVRVPKEAGVTEYRIEIE